MLLSGDLLHDSKIMKIKDFYSFTEIPLLGN